MKQQSFDDIIKQKAQQYEAPVPADAWENIMQGKKKKRRYIFFWWTLGLLLIGGGMVFFYTTKGNGKTIAVINNNQQEGILPKISSQKETTDKSTIYSTDSIIQEEKENNTVEAGNAVGQDQNKINNIPAAEEITIVQPGIDNQTKKKSIINETSGQEIEIINASKSKPLKIPVNNKNNKADEGSTAFGITNPAIDEKDKTALPVTNERSATATEQTITSVTPGATTGSFPAITITSNYSADSAIIGKKDSATLVTTAVTKPVIVNQTDSTKRPARKKGWSIDASITPFAAIQQNESLLSVMRTGLTNEYKKEFTSSDVQTVVKPALAFTIAARKKINKKLEWGTGFQYARISEKVKLTGTETTTTYPVVQRLTTDNTGTHLVDDTLENVSTGIRTINAFNSYSVFSVPVFIQYSLLQKSHFSLLLTTGAYVNVVKYKNSIKGDFTTVYSSGLQPGSQPVNMGVDLFTGLRFTSVPRRKYQFFAEPVFRYGWLKNNAAGMINAKHIHRAGLSLGVSYNLN